MDAAHTFERFAATTNPPIPPGTAGQGQKQVEIVVIHTTIEATRKAMQAVLQLAKDLEAHVRLLAPQIVPQAAYGVPPVSIRFLADQLLPLTGAIATLVDIRLGSDRWDIIRNSLPPASLVVVGGRRFWPWRDRRLAMRLQKAGHNVLFVKSH